VCRNVPNVCCYTQIFSVIGQREHMGSFLSFVWFHSTLRQEIGSSTPNFTSIASGHFGGATENAGVENAGALKMQGVENAGVENTAP